MMYIYYNIEMQPVAEALYLTTSFQKKSPLHPERSYSYCRTKNPNFTTLENHLINLYPGSDKAILFPSGLNAIAVLFQIFASEGGVFIVGDQMYGDTFNTLEYIKDIYEDFTYYTVDVTDTDKIRSLAEKLNNRVKLFFFESCSNSDGFIPDFDEIKKIKETIPNAKMAIDNSWMSGILFNPLEYGADIVMESLSKYIGAGKVIMGALVGTTAVLTKVHQYRRAFGIRTSQYDAWTASEMILTLRHRMHYLSAITPEIALFLFNHPKVTDIQYPLLEKHSSYQLARKYFKGGPGIILFHIPVKGLEAIRFSDQNENILYSTSYGKPETTICPYQHEDDNGTWVRLSIGWASDRDQIIGELEKRLSLMNYNICF